MLNDPRVSACIVLYHSPDTVMKTIRCVQSSTIPVDLYVVDNSPQDPLGRRIAAGCRNVCLISMKKNVGFARANNEVLSRLSSTYHLILNPDVTFDPDLLERMVRFMDQHKDVMVLTPRVFNTDGTEQFLPKRRPTVRYLLGSRLEAPGDRAFAQAEALAEEEAQAARTAREAWQRHDELKASVGDLFRCRSLQSKADRLARRRAALYARAARLRRWRWEYTLRDTDVTGPMEVQFATGCFLLIRTHLFHRLNGFDPHFFLYHEDSDLSMTVQRKGKIIYHPDMHVTHEWRRDSKRSWIGLLHHVRSTIRFFNKWGWKW